MKKVKTENDLVITKIIKDLQKKLSFPSGGSIASQTLAKIKEHSLFEI